MEHLQANSDLLIGQWQDSPKLRAAIDAPIDVLNEEVLPALDSLEKMRNIDTAEGIWLDFIGRRLGIDRPATTDFANDKRFGFTGVTQAEGFDSRPFLGDSENDAVFPLPDEIYRKILKARAITVQSKGTFQAFHTAVKIIDPGAAITDNRDMTVRVVTANQEVLEIADHCGALPRNTGVKIEYADTNVFGYDESGVPFDQGYFRP